MAVGHAVRLLTDQNPQATVLFVDGIGANDHVYRSAMLSKLLEVPKLRGLIPLVRQTYARRSCYSWEDDVGEKHLIWQGEGGEQGDPLMPLLFSLAMHNALADVKSLLHEDEHLFAFLDDV